MRQRSILPALLVAAVVAIVASLDSGTARAAGPGQPTDWKRFYYYPYVYYPHAFQQQQTFNHLYYKYPANMRIPVYNKSWHNYYPGARRYHSGHHFILDVF